MNPFFNLPTLARNITTCLFIGCLLHTPKCIAADWEIVSSGTTENLESVTWDGNRFIAVDGKSGVFESTDGRAWLKREIPQYDETTYVIHHANSVLAGDGKILVLDLNGSYHESIDRVSWFARESGQDRTLYGGIWNSGQYVLVGDRGVILTSEDGLNWQQNTTSPTTRGLRSITHGKELYLAGGSDGVFTSPDAETWTPRSTGALFPVTDVAASSQRFVAVTWAEVLTSVDGTTWSKTLISPLQGPPYANAVCAGGSKFVLVCNGGKAFETTNGRTCTPIDLLTTSDINDLAYAKGMFVAVGDGGLIRVSGNLSEGSPPTATPGSALALAGKKAPLLLSGSDPDGESLTYTIVAAPSAGTLQGTPPNLIYTARRGYNGLDSFSFIVNDGFEDSAPATFAIQVKAKNRLPVAKPLTMRVANDSAVPVMLAGSDPDSDELGFRVVQSPTQGILTGTPPNLIYQARAGFLGVDRFTYLASDGIGISKPASVSIKVMPAGWINGVPVALGQTLTTPVNKPLRMFLGGSDSDADPITFQVIGGPNAGLLKGKPPKLTYVPPRNFSGTASFTFKVSDGDATSEFATVEIHVTTNPMPTSVAVRSKADSPAALVSSEAAGIAARPNLSIQKDASAPSRIVLTIQGAPTSTYLLQSSDDLRNWTDFQKIDLDQTGSANIIIPILAHREPRFFRLADE